MHKPKKHIVLVASEFPPLPGGIGTHAHYLAKHLDGLGYEVSVLADHRDWDVTEERDFDATLSFVVHRIRRRRFRALMYLQRILKYRQLLSSSGVVLASGKFPLWLVAFGSFGYSKVNRIGILHGSEVNFQKPLLKYSINRALKCFDKLVAVSNFTAHLVQSQNLDVTVIPNGIEVSDWEMTLKDSSLAQSEAYPVLVTVGNVTERKGQRQVIEWLPHLLNVYPKIQYACIGLPTEVEQLRAEAQRLGVEEHVHFHGRLSQEKMKEVLSGSDVFVMLSQHTSSGDMEGFGIAILEANALGLPAIGSSGSGIEDAIAHGKSGFLVPSSDGKAFKEALKTILETPDHYRKEARVWAHSHAWKLLVKQYQRVIETCI